jgi:apolipoprotein D and lipocalin family protein
MKHRSLLRSKAAVLLPLTLAGAALVGCATAPSPPLPTVAAVDLQRYTGTWHEIAVVPNRFQSQCVADTQARYRVAGDGIEVLNRCRKADGAVDEITGTARVVDGSGNAKLRVTFFWPFYGDYWVLALDPDYRWVLVGEPGRRFGWVLSRTPQLAPTELEVAMARAEALGYDRAAFKPTPQTRPLP